MLPTCKPVYKRLRHEINGKKYMLCESAEYFSERFGKFVEVKNGMLSDGATGAMDLKDSWSWWFHDQLCDTCTWEEGSYCSAWEASMVLCDILDEEGRELRKYTWKWMTFLCGSWKIKRKVGWFPVDDEERNTEGGS